MTDPKTTLPEYREVQLDCQHCDGEGSVYVKHPQWGLPYCPEDSILSECGECEGTGKRWAEIDENGEEVK